MCHLGTVDVCCSDLKFRSHLAEFFLNISRKIIILSMISDSRYLTSCISVRISADAQRTSSHAAAGMWRRIAL